MAKLSAKYLTSGPIDISNVTKHYSKLTLFYLSSLGILNVYLNVGHVVSLFCDKSNYFCSERSHWWENVVYNWLKSNFKNLMRVKRA